ncbi:MAG: hypothetical protein IH840_03310 [Candidatus Heimdallarchaeota archaeon]|nr:hypothetical protein [Candidatus Heimdallarchaeota archaeon]
MTQLQINEERIDKYFDLHIKVLRNLARGKPYQKIKGELLDEFESLNYEQFGTDFSLLSFDQENKLRGAFPLSPKQTDYLLEVQGLGTSYAMCAIDALGAAYTFKAKTTIHSRDHISGSPIKIVIDPHQTDYSQYKDYVISMPKSPVSAKKEESWDAAIDLCPLIGFFENEKSIPKNQLDIVDILPFEVALKYGKTIFDLKKMRLNLKNWIKVLINLYETDRTEDALLSHFRSIETLPNHWSEAEIRQLLIGGLEGKGLLRPHDEKIDTFILTLKGKRVANLFIDQNSTEPANGIDNKNHEVACDSCSIAALQEVR